MVVDRLLYTLGIRAAWVEIDFNWGIGSGVNVRVNTLEEGLPNNLLVTGARLDYLCVV